MKEHSSTQHPLAASIAHTIAQLSPKDQASVVSGFYAIAAPYLSNARAEPAEPPAEPQGEVEDDGPDASEEGIHTQPLTEVEQDILDFLKRVPATSDGHPVAFKGDEIAHGIDKAYNYIRGMLAPGAPLREQGLIDHRRNVGYWSVSRDE